MEIAASLTVSARAEAVRSGVKSQAAAAAPPRDISLWSCVVEDNNCRLVVVCKCGNGEISA